MRVYSTKLNTNIKYFLCAPWIAKAPLNQTHSAPALQASKQSTPFVRAPVQKKLIGSYAINRNDSSRKFRNFMQLKIPLKSQLQIKWMVPMQLTWTWISHHKRTIEPGQCDVAYVDMQCAWWVQICFVVENFYPVLLYLLSVEKGCSRLS